MAHRFLYRKRLKRTAAASQGGAGRRGLQFTSIFGGVFLASVFAATALFFGTAMGVYAFVAKDLPAPDSLANREIARSAKILDRNGELLYEIFDRNQGRRTTVDLDEVSPYLIQATIATEDSSFYENQGINFRGITRAFWNALATKEITQGGSSITQQLVKNVFIPEEERTQISIVRKLKEMVLSLELTRRFSKDKILEYYLNEIYYGNLSYGIESAAESYYAKRAKDLNLAEAAMLAGIPQAPSLFSPLSDPERARARQHQVLDLMVRQGFISEVEAEAAKETQLKFSPAKFDIRAPHFVMSVQEMLEEKYGARTLYRGGLTVTTSLDIRLQEMGEEIVRDQVAKTRAFGAHSASLVALDPRTGEVLAMVGSADYFDPSILGQNNMVTAPRQPGSSFKPFTYVTAFMKGWTPATIVLDTPISFRDGNTIWSPRNFDNKFRGPVSIRQALANSMNLPAVRTMQFTGVEPVIETAHKMGITTLNEKATYGLALTLGGGEVKLLDLAFAYGVFANQGKMAGAPVQPENQKPGHRTLDPVAILKIEDHDGRVLEEFKAPQERQVIPPEYAYLLSHILSDNEARAPVFGGSLRLPGGRPAAVKTGTTDNVKDFWTMGYTPELVAGVWMGNADNTALRGGFSGTTTGPIWEKFMAAALAGEPITPFPRPSGVVTVTVCASTGSTNTRGCSATRQEVFVRGQTGTTQGALYTTVRIDKATGLLATEHTPPENIEERTYLNVPQEAREYAQEQGRTIEAPPTQFSPPPTPTPTPAPAPRPVQTQPAPSPTATPPARPVASPTPAPTQPAAQPAPTKPPPPQPTATATPPRSTTGSGPGGLRGTERFRPLPPPPAPSPSPNPTLTPR